VQLANQANAAGQPSRVLIAAGVYRESVTLDAGQKTDALMILEGAGPTTVLTGADDWTTGWTAQPDGSLVHQWPYRWGMKPIPNGWGGYWNWDGNGYKRDILRRSEMVYVNGAPLRGVLTLGELATAGTFYVDESTGRLHMRLPGGISLSGASIEVGVRVTPLTIAGRRNLTLRNFAVMRSRGAVQDSAIAITNSQNVVIEDFQMRWGAFGGLAASTITGLQIRRSIIADNGVKGLAAAKIQTGLMEDSEVARNNWRGWPVEHKGWDSVQKWTMTRDVVIRRSRFVDNWGHGLWFDTDNQRTRVEDIFSARNHMRGVYFEANGGPITIQRSRMCSNATAGVTDARSNKISVLNNEIFDNGYYQIEFTGQSAAFSVTDFLTGQAYTVSSSDWTITGNKVKGGPQTGTLPSECWPGPCGWTIWVANSEQYSYVARTLTADNNQWYHSSATNSFRVPPTYGTAVNSSTFKTLMSTVKPNEVNSSWGNPGPLSCTAPTP
jgi:hypothetical protein